MTAIYLAAAIVGAPFVGYFVISGFESGDEAGGTTDDGSVAAADFLTLRSFAFLAAFFGVTGMLLSGLGVSVAVSIPSAAAVGFFAMWLNARLVSLVRGGDGWGLTAGMVVGREAEVVVPFDASTEGTIAIALEGRVVELVAAADHGQSFSAGDRVVVVEVGEAAAWVVAAGERP